MKCVFSSRCSLCSMFSQPWCEERKSRINKNSPAAGYQCTRAIPILVLLVLEQQYNSSSTSAHLQVLLLVLVLLVLLLLALVLEELNLPSSAPPPSLRQSVKCEPLDGILKPNTLAAVPLLMIDTKF